MQQIRQLLQKPAIGWAVAGLAILFSAYTLYRFGFGASGPYDARRMQQDVVIRFADTGEEVRMPRGRFEKMLREKGNALKSDEGIVNPATGKATGFLIAKDEWEETVQRIQGENSSVSAMSPWGAAGSSKK